MHNTFALSDQNRTYFDSKRGKDLIKDVTVNTLSLRKSLQLFGFTNKQMKWVPDEILMWDVVGNIVCLPANKLRKQVDEVSPVRGLLSETKKVIYRPQFEPVIFGGVASGQLFETDIKFYRALHKDTFPFLKVHSLWLAVPEFQELLKSNIPHTGINNSLELDEFTGMFIPRFQSVPGLWGEKKPKRYRQDIGEIKASLIWDDVTHKWAFRDI